MPKLIDRSLGAVGASAAAKAAGSPERQVDARRELDRLRDTLGRMSPRLAQTVVLQRTMPARRGTPHQSIGRRSCARTSTAASRQIRAPCPPKREPSGGPWRPSGGAMIPLRSTGSTPFSFAIQGRLWRRTHRWSGFVRCAGWGEAKPRRPRLGSTSPSTPRVLPGTKPSAWRSHRYSVPPQSSHDRSRHTCGSGLEPAARHAHHGLQLWKVRDA
jgi:hypothetical protein